MDYKKTAKDIIKGVGGSSNIQMYEHCSTRLRLTLKDDSQADINFLKTIDGVIGVRQNVQTQIIIGNEVNEIYTEFVKLLGGDTASEQNKNTDQKSESSFVNRIFGFLIGVFQPLVPAIAGGGMLKSLLLLLNLFNIVTPESTTYQFINFMGDAPLYFLPLLVSVSVARRLQANELVALSIGGFFILPGIGELLGTEAILLGLSVPAIDYAYQVFPALLITIFYSFVERFLTKYTPKSIRIFFVPMVSLFVSGILGLLLLGPIGFQVGQLISTVIVALFESIGWIATGLLAAVLPFMVATGMHKAMLPYAVSTMTALGSELLYMPASLAHNISESGAAFAVALKTKETNTRSTALSAGISALFGITEPALYGVTLQNKKVMISVVISSLINGAFVGIIGLEAFALVGPGLASITMFTNPNDNMNLIWAFVALISSIVISFIITYIVYEDATKTIEESSADKIRLNSDESTENTGELVLFQPVEGKILPLESVNDEVFSSGLMGDGTAIMPTEGVLYSPMDAKIKMLFGTNHAIGLELDNGLEILIHIGLDTVELDGNGFEALVAENQLVKQGDKLIKFDINYITENGYDPTVIIVITNKEQYEVKEINVDGNNNVNEILLSLGKVI